MLLVAVAAVRGARSTLVASQRSGSGWPRPAKRAKEELEASLYFHRIALADRELSADNLGRALELLDECPPGLRQWEWYYLERLCRVEPVILRDYGRGPQRGVPAPTANRSPPQAKTGP